MGLKDIYYYFEEKYYALLDKLDEFIPINSIVDKIDGVVPSFSVFIGLTILLICLAILFFTGGLFAPATATLSITVEDSEGNIVENATVSLTGLDSGLQKELKTPASGSLVVNDLSFGSRIDLIIEKREFKRYTTSILLDQAQKSLSIRLEPEILPPPPHTVIFASPDGQKLVGVEINAHFECTNSGISLSEMDFVVTSGEVTLIPPIGCGFLTIQATTNGYKELREVLDLPGKTLRFESFPQPKGTVTVFVRDSENNSTLENMKISFNDAEGFPAGSSQFTVNGEASASLAPGNYEVLVEDPSGRFGSERTEAEVFANQSTSVSVELTRKLAATLKIRVVEKGTDNDIEDAKVVVKKSGQAFGERTISDEEPEAVFALKEKGIYSYTASHPDYLVVSETQLDLSNAPPQSMYDLKVELEKCTDSTCGVLRVRVTDETNAAVENAKVFLFDADVNTIMTELGERTTDANGYALDYRNLDANKNVYAIAQKYPSQGQSRPVKIDAFKVNLLEVKMIIGKGEIVVEATTSSGAPVPFALVDVLNVNGQTVGSFSLDETGHGSLSTKADKEVFVRVRKQGFNSFFSAPKQVFRNAQFKVGAILSEGQVSDKAKAVFLGLFDETGSLVSQTIEAGKNYVARFNVLVPGQKSYSEEGLHVRTGNSTNFDEDKVFIASAKAALAKVAGSRTFNPPNGSATDLQNMSSKDVKWLDVVWTSPEAGTYEVEVNLRVKPETVQGAELPLFYRSWGKDGPIYDRDPFDQDLGENEASGSKHGIYANSYKQVFFEGAQKVCDDNFCFSQRVVDLSEGLVLNGPFSLRVFDNYKVFFSITNNSGTLHDKADLRTKVTADGVAVDNSISMENYSITNADGNKFSAIGPVYELPNIPLGYFSPFKSVEGEFLVKPSDIKSTSIQLRIISGTPEGTEVFNKSIDFDIRELDEVEVTVEPKQLIAFKPIELLIHTVYETGAKKGRPIDNAQVIVTKTDPSGFETFIQAITDENGYVIVDVCMQAGCSPGTLVTIQVQKPGVKSDPFELEITDAVVEFEPEELEFNLNLSTVKAEQKSIEITNLIPESVKISRILLRGSFDGVLDIEKMNAFLQQFVNNAKIDFEDKSTLRVLVELNDDARLLEEKISTQGSLLLDIRDIEETATWPMKEIPLTINVDLGVPPKDPNCIAISSPVWEDSVLETTSSKQFSIVNNCFAETGEPLDLKNLQATIEWASDEVGQIVLTVQNPSTGETSTQVLQGGVNTIVLESLRQGDEVLATLAFVPKPSHVGEQALFKVKFAAELLTSSGRSLVNASKEIDAKLFIINLRGCITANPEFEQVVSFGQDDQGTVTISTEECGPIPIDLRFCYGDSGCTGGAKEGSIGISPTSFSDVMADEKSINVTRETISGLYGIRVEARPRGGGWREIGDILVLFEPQADTAFKLSKYDFIIIGTGAKDTATLTNSLLSETITVDASACDWKTAEEDNDFFNFAGAGIGAAVGGLLGAGPAINAAKIGAQAVALPKTGAAAQAIGQTTTAKGTATGVQAPLTKTVESTAETSAAVKAIPPCVFEPPYTGASLATANTSAASAAASASSAQTSLETALGMMEAANTTALEAQQTAASGAGPTAAAQTSAAAGMMQAATDEMVAATSSVQTACAAMKKVQADAEITKDSLSEYSAEASGQADYWAAQGQPELATACAASASEASTALASAASTFATSGAGIPTCETAATSANTAATSMGTATGQMTALSGQEAAMSESFNTGRFFALEGLFVGLGFAGGGLLGGLLDEDECKERHQYPLSDYIMNLKVDARAVVTDNKGIQGEWNTQEAFVFGEYAAQDVGVVFTNKGIEDPRPVYSTASFTSLRHHHNPTTIIPKGFAQFAPFNVPDSGTEIYTQKFHLRFKTAELEEPLPDLGAGAAACATGLNVGRTGEGTLPKVKFDWNWKNFTQNSCDSSNPDAIYCDATQFAFEMSYRLDALKEFIDKNREKLLCPENPADSFAGEMSEGFLEEIQNGDLPSFGNEGKISIVSYHYAYSQNNLTVSVVVANDSNSLQNATIRVDLEPPEGVNVEKDFCEIVFDSIPANDRQTKNCKFENLAESAQSYSATVKMAQSSTGTDDTTFDFRAKVQSSISCWMPATTELYDGRPGLDYYVEAAANSITWTQRVPNRQALNELLVFDALLIKDGYSDDFLQDFADYSNEIIFFDTPAFFNKLGTNTAGQQYGFDAFYKNGAIQFSKKYVDGPAQLSQGGTYRVETKIDFGGFWQFFDSQGNPYSNVNVRLQLLKPPEPNHVFYNLPLDGFVGLESATTFDRKGYGTGFINENPDRLVKLHSSEDGFKTFESSSSSNPLATAHVQYVDGFFELNSNPLTRGSILSIENTGTNAKLRFAPSLATPVMMKMHSSERDDSFGAYYSLLEDSAKVNVGSVLTYWSGAGMCLDFSGEHVKDAFDFKPDRLATQEDRFVNWQNTYTTQWLDSLNEGDVFLQTVFYSTPFKDTELKVEGPIGGFGFLSPDEGPESVLRLAGISSMPYNNAGQTVSSMEEVFELLKQGVICETSTGNKVSYWWNPQTLLEFEGNAPCLNCSGKRSLVKEELALEARNTCIGPQ